MNLLAHVQVALAVDAGAAGDELVVLGAILPDLESLVGERLEVHRAHPSVARGVALHHESDAAFHGDARFTAGWIALSRDLRARGVGRGPARAVGHAGWELLLDGLLVEERPVTDAFDAAVAAIGSFPDGGPGARRLVELGHRGDEVPFWAGYADPAQVAQRLHRQLQRRPRIAFPADHLERVGAGLVAALPHVGAHGPTVLADVAASLS